MMMTPIAHLFSDLSSKGHHSMKKAGALLLPLFVDSHAGYIACGKSAGTGNNPGTSTPANQVTMDATDFVNNAVTIKAGGSVHFDDPSDSGGTHIICSGENGQCTTSSTRRKTFRARLPDRCGPVEGCRLRQGWHLQDHLLHPPRHEPDSDRSIAASELTDIVRKSCHFMWAALSSSRRSLIAR